MKILIKNVDIITADDSRMLIENGKIAVKDEHIVFVGAADAVLADFEADRVIDGRQKLAMPGLVNAHTHCGMTLLRNYADDLALEEWLFDRIFPAEEKLEPEDIYWGTLLGIAEMIKSGTTAFADMYLHMDMVALAVTETGIRANLSKSPAKFNACGTAEKRDAGGCFEYYRNWNGSAQGRIRVYLEVHSAYLFDEDSLRWAADLAKQCGTGIHVHILETAREREESIKRYGMNSAQICAECGIFDVPVIGAHCVHLSDEDIQLLKEKSVNIIHNPTSNLKLGSGIARVPDFLDLGLNVSLGTDGTASNNNLNMFEEMHLAALIHKGVNRNPMLVNAEQAIKMATVNGAKAIGFGDAAGCIREGMKADLILLDMDKPHLYPMNDPVSAVIYSAQGADVDTVMVDGRILMEGRELKSIDEEMVKYRVGKITEKL